MTTSICLDYGEIQTAFGDLSQTVAALMQGRSGIQPGPCFGSAVPFAPFADARCRDLVSAAWILARGTHLSSLNSPRTLVIFTAAKGDIRALDAASPAGFPSPLLGEQAQLVQSALGLDRCESTVVSNACASGAIALETAADLMRTGHFDSSVIIAYDSISRFVTSGFMSLGALSPDRARPFDRARNGLTLGEGAALAVLARREPRQGDIVLAGAGSSNDANHRTGPSRTGDGLRNAAAAAIAEAGLAAVAIAAVKCHGTATPYNDAMEAKALASLFGASVPPCASFKGALGHSSGASSLVEAIVAAACLHERTLPPTAGFETLGVDEPIPVSSSPQPLDIGKTAILCLSAGFGGVNAAIVLREAA